MPVTSSIAYLDTNRRVVVTGDTGTRPLDVGGDDVIWGRWSHDGEPDVHSWPAWSPDGSRVAAFRIARTGGRSRVWVTDVDGVSGVEVAEMGSRVPIYLQWSPEGDQLGVLSQEDRQLVLQVADPRAEAEDQEWLRGSPLFFTWVRGGRIAAFVGRDEGSRPTMSVVGADAQHDLSGTPGNFCTPVRTARGLAYVAHVRGHVALLVSSLDGSHVRELEQLRGLVALLGSPDGLRLARAVSADGSGTPYRDLSLVEVDTAATTPVSDLPCVAFFFLPQGDAMVLACTSGDLNEVKWVRVGFDGSQTELFTLQPSRDFRVYLRFFEQYSLSHPIVDPAGTNLLLTGVRPGGDPDLPGIFQVPLDGAEPRRVDDGLFACFAPARAPEP